MRKTKNQMSRTFFVFAAEDEFVGSCSTKIICKRARGFTKIGTKLNIKREKK